MKLLLSKFSNFSQKNILNRKIEYNPLLLETTTSPTVVKKLSGIIGNDIQSLQSTVTQVCIFLQHRICRTGDNHSDDEFVFSYE